MGLESLVKVAYSGIRSVLSLAGGSIRDDYAQFFGIDSYHAWDGPFGYANTLDNLAYANPRRIEPFCEGKSTEGRPILAAKISADVRYPRPFAFLFTGMIHAREFISGEACLHIAQCLLQDYNDGDVTVRKILDCAEVYVLPVLNPDSFVKNVDAVEASKHFGWLLRRNPRGVDLNRNFDDNFDGRAWTNKIPFSAPFNEEYAGSHAFSEAESKAVRDFVLRRFPHIVAAMNFHSASNVVLYQPGSSMNTYAAQQGLARRIADEIGYDAVQLSHFLEYASGRFATRIRHPTVEGSLDGWLHQKCGVRSLLVEIGELNLPLLLASHLAGYNPPPKDMRLHTDKCYRAARRMMSDVLSIIGW